MNSTRNLRIDVHQHFWEYQLRDYGWIDESMSVLKRSFLPDDLKPVLDAHKMDGCVAVQARASIEENSFLTDIAKANPWIKGVVGWLDFTANNFAEELSEWNSYSVMKGYRAMVQDQPDPAAYLALPLFNKSVDQLLKSGKVYELLIHAKDLSPASEFCARHQEGQIVLCHMGKPDVQHESAKDWAKRLAPLAKVKNVACKMSGLITEAKWHTWKAQDLAPYFETALELFGPSRLMFGSDWPVCLCSGSIEQVYELAEMVSSRLSGDEQSAVWGNNAARIYSLSNS